MPMSFDGHAASSSGCAIKPKVHGTGSAAFVGRTGISLRTGSYGMATAEHREPCDSRGSCTVLGAPGGESPPGDSTRVRLPAPLSTRQMTLRKQTESLQRRERRMCATNGPEQARQDWSQSRWVRRLAPATGDPHQADFVILEVDCSAEDSPIPRHHFIQAGRLEGDMMQRGFDDRHWWPPNTFSTSIAQLNAALKSSTNCLVVIGARPTRSSISLVFSVEKPPAAPTLAKATLCVTRQSGMPRDFMPCSACSGVMAT